MHHTPVTPVSRASLASRKRVLPVSSATPTLPSIIAVMYADIPSSRRLRTRDTRPEDTESSVPTSRET
jgi:hypothetical protein